MMVTQAVGYRGRYDPSVHLSSILIPHDGSPFAGAVVGAIGPLLRPGAVVTLLHVEDSPANYDEALAAAAREVAGHGARVVRREVASDDPARAILDVAAEIQPDLVGMSTQGRSGLKRWVLGSVAEKVLRLCPAPVLMVNPRTHSVSSYNRMLVPLDASEYSAQILDTLIPLARTYEASLTLLYVDFDDPTDSQEQAARRQASRKVDIEGWLAKPLLRATEAGLAVEMQIAQGDVAEVIDRLAKPGEFDLVALGPSRGSVGSITTKVLRSCPIPVLLHRTQHSPAAEDRTS